MKNRRREGEKEKKKSQKVSRLESPLGSVSGLAIAALDLSVITEIILLHTQRSISEEQTGYMLGKASPMQ